MPHSPVDKPKIEPVEYHAPSAAAPHNDATPEAYTRINEALQLAGRHAGLQGAHHLTWLVDQMVRALAGDGYDNWVEAHPDWTTGVAP